MAAGHTARRKFDEALNALPPDKREGTAALTGLDYCNKLFAWEEWFSREGKTIPLSTTADGNASPASDVLPPDMVKTAGGTTFEIYFHFSQTSRETFTDKVLCLIQSNTVTSKK